MVHSRPLEEKKKKTLAIQQKEGKTKEGRKERKLKHKVTGKASLVAQWLRICLPTQGTRVRALVWEDPTCHGATGPVSHNY